METTGSYPAGPHTLYCVGTDPNAGTATSSRLSQNVYIEDSNLTSFTLTPLNPPTDQVQTLNGTDYVLGNVIATCDYSDPGLLASAKLCQIDSNNQPTSNFALTAIPASPQPAGTTIMLMADTGEPNVQYQFWVYNPSVTPAWTQLQAYSANATCLWNPLPRAPICSPPPRRMTKPVLK